MRALFSAELYRLLKQKSTYIILGLCLFFMMLNSSLMGFLLGNADWLKEIYENLMNSGVMNYYDTGTSQQLMAIFNAQASSTAEFIAVNLRGDIVFFIAAFEACFYAAEKKHGYIKNLAFRYDRPKIFLTHSILGLIFTAVLTILSTVFVGLISNIFLKGVDFGRFWALAGYVGVLILLYWTLLNFILICIDLFKSTTAAMALVFVYLSLGSELLYSLIDVILGAAFNASVSIRFFTPVGSLSVISFGDSKSCWTSVLCAVVYSAIAYLIEFFSMRNRDLA